MKIVEMTSEQLEALLAEHKRLNPDLPIRPDIKESLELYLSHGIRPGQFLVAVLENDLFEAMSRADSYNAATIHQIVIYIYNRLPCAAFGSRERVQEWLAHFHGPKGAA